MATITRTRRAAQIEVLLERFGYHWEDKSSLNGMLWEKSTVYGKPMRTLGYFVDVFDAIEHVIPIVGDIEFTQAYDLITLPELTV